MKKKNTGQSVKSTRPSLTRRAAIFNPRLTAVIFPAKRVTFAFVIFTGTLTLIECQLRRMTTGLQQMLDYNNLLPFALQNENILKLYNIECLFFGLVVHI